MKSFRVGLNAHLLSQSQSYRQAGVSRYIHGLLDYLPLVDPTLDFHAYLGQSHDAFLGWTTHHAADWTSTNPAGRILWEQTVLPGQTQRDRLDLLHVPVNIAPLSHHGALVATIHDLTFMRFPEAFKPERRFYQTQFTRCTAKRADKIITGSGTSYNDLVELLNVPPERIALVPDGIDPRLARASQAEIERFRAQKELPERFFLYVGTLEPRKNLPFLLEAYALACRELPAGHKLVLAGGKGWYYEAVYAAVERLGLSKRVILPGFVPDEELALWYSAAEVFVYASLYEGFGLPPLEAMACGTPAIVSDTPALCEVVADAGLIVGTGDVEAMASAMVSLDQDFELRARLTHASLKRASLYSWERTARETAAVYRTILGE